MGPGVSIGEMNTPVLEVLTADELATRLRVGVIAIYKLKRAGAIPFVLVGRQVRYELAAVIRALGVPQRGRNPLASGLASGEELP